MPSAQSKTFTCFSPDLGAPSTLLRTCFASVRESQVFPIALLEKLTTGEFGEDGICPVTHPYGVSDIRIKIPSFRPRARESWNQETDGTLDYRFRGNDV